MVWGCKGCRGVGSGGLRVLGVWGFRVRGLGFRVYRV